MLWNGNEFGKKTKVMRISKFDALDSMSAHLESFEIGYWRRMGKIS
jgi:hypothetical protein